MRRVQLQHRIVSITDPAGGTYQYAYGAQATLDSVTYPDSSVRQYQYTNAAFPRALTGLLDEGGGLFASWTYDAVRAARLESARRGRRCGHVAYTNCARVAHGAAIKAVTTDALGAARTYNLTTRLGMNKVTSFVQPAASGTGTATTSYTYDANNNVTRRKDFRGFLTCYTFDLTRNLETQRVEGLSGTNCPGTTIAGITRTITTTWDATFRLPNVITEAGRTTDYDYDASGNVTQKVVTDTSVTPNVSRTWAYTYDTYGRRLTEDGPRTDVSDVTTYTYYTCTSGYECGQVHTVTNAAGQVVTFNTYNVHGQPLTITDANSVLTTLAYDSRQRLTSRTVGSETTTLEYWPTGLLKKVTQADSTLPALYL